MLRAGGDEFESEVPFAAADQLLRSGGGEAAVLREGQHVAVGLELLELMTAGPSVVVVDDAHFVDGDSLRALLFAARRLGSAQRAVDPGRPRARGRVAGDLGQAGAGGVDVATGAGSRPRLGDGAGHPPDRGGGRAPVEPTPTATRCTCARCSPSSRATGAWQQEDRPLPVPHSYAELVRTRLERFNGDVVALVEAAAVLGVRAPLEAVARVAELEQPLEAIDAAVATELVDLRRSSSSSSCIRSRAPRSTRRCLKAARAGLNARRGGVVDGRGRGAAASRGGRARAGGRARWRISRPTRKPRWRAAPGRARSRA